MAGPPQPPRKLDPDSVPSPVKCPSHSSAPSKDHPVLIAPRLASVLASARALWLKHGTRSEGFLPCVCLGRGHGIQALHERSSPCRSFFDSL